MYCVKCGVELKDSEKTCPLCQTPVFHPDIKQGECEKPYGEYEPEEKGFSKRGILFVVSVLFGLTALLTLLIDLRVTPTIAWSGYVIGGLILAYLIFILPLWFKHPNPVIFTPAFFAAVVLFLLYINLKNGGGWFLSFAFPVAGIAGLIVTALVTLLRYLKKGHLFIYGGALIAVGIYTVLIEMFVCITFEGVKFVMWSLYPFVSCVVIGLMLIVIGICKPLRESLSRKFFI